MRQALLVLLVPVLRMRGATDGNSEADRGKHNTNERLSYILHSDRATVKRSVGGPRKRPTAVPLSAIADGRLAGLVFPGVLAPPGPM